MPRNCVGKKPKKVCPENDASGRSTPSLGKPRGAHPRGEREALAVEGRAGEARVPGGGALVEPRAVRAHGHLGGEQRQRNGQRLPVLLQVQVFVGVDREPAVVPRALGAREHEDHHRARDHGPRPAPPPPPRRCFLRHRRPHPPPPLPPPPPLRPLLPRPRPPRLSPAARTHPRAATASPRPIAGGVSPPAPADCVAHGLVDDHGHGPHGHPALGRGVVAAEALRRGAPTASASRPGAARAASARTARPCSSETGTRRPRGPRGASPGPPVVATRRASPRSVARRAGAHQPRALCYEAQPRIPTAPAAESGRGSGGDMKFFIDTADLEEIRKAAPDRAHRRRDHQPLARREDGAEVPRRRARDLRGRRRSHLRRGALHRLRGHDARGPRLGTRCTATWW
jgi:hypothetical protein